MSRQLLNLGISDKQIADKINSGEETLKSLSDRLGITYRYFT